MGIPMKILTIVATASALALSTASAFAGHAGEHKAQQTRDFYAVAASGQTGGFANGAADQVVAAAPVNPENAVRGSIYRVSRHNDRAIARGEDRGVALMAYRHKTKKRPAPINAENGVRESIYRVNRHNDRATARRVSRPHRMHTSSARDDRPFGPMYQPQDQVRQSMYDVNEGKHGNVREYYYR